MEELKIGIVAEGISDYWVLKHIIERVLRDKEPEVISLQPKVLNGKQNGFGGWQNVFEYIEKEEYIINIAKVEEFDYVVVQIDTDVANQYGVTKTSDITKLYNDVATTIASKLHPNFNPQKIIFAICIDSLECWLIPFVATQNCGVTNNCVKVVNRAIKTKNIGTIDKNNKSAAKKTYDEILSYKKKIRDIENISVHNYGFEKFIESLKAI